MIAIMMRNVTLFHRNNSLQIPIYFSQSLVLVSKFLTNKLLCDNCTINCNKNRLTCDDYQVQLYYSKYVLYPYQFTCWYITSYKMIIQNRYYHIAHSCRKLMRQICNNFINRINCFSHQLTFCR
jgi:hypothetical protein